MNNQIKEKRRYLRLKKQLPLRLSDEGQFDITAYTRDISQRGALCELAHQIPLMSKVQIKLLLPTHESSKTASAPITCLGVVVRSQAVIKDSGAFYDTAIFFTKLTKTDEKKIARYVEGNISYQDQNTASDMSLN